MTSEAQASDIVVPPWGWICTFFSDKKTKDTIWLKSGHNLDV